MDSLKITSINPMNEGAGAPPIQKTPRCLARNRRGFPCQNFVMRGRARCRLHGGKATGPPKGNRNAWKHGRFSAEAVAARRRTQEVIAEFRKLIDGL